jgi:hypothetical protein
MATGWQKVAANDENRYEEDAPEGYKGPQKKDGQRVYGKKNPRAWIEERQQRLYKRQLEGLPARHLVLEHASREGISEATAWRDWNCVAQWNQSDWDAERESILSRINAMRLRVIDKAIRRGQLSTAADLLRQLGAAAGEGQEMAQMQAAPQLNISVELPASESAGALPAADLVDIDAQPAD